MEGTTQTFCPQHRPSIEIGQALLCGALLFHPLWPIRMARMVAMKHLIGEGLDFLRYLFVSDLGAHPSSGSRPSGRCIHLGGFCGAAEGCFKAGPNGHCDCACIDVSVSHGRILSSRVSDLTANLICTYLFIWISACLSFQNFFCLFTRPRSMIKNVLFFFANPACPLTFLIHFLISFGVIYH